VKQASAEIQAGLKTALETALTGTYWRVTVDDVIPGNPQNLLVIGESAINDDSAQGLEGADELVTLHYYDHGTTASIDVKTAMATVVSALQHTPITLSNDHTNVCISLDGSNIFREGDTQPATRVSHGIQTWRIRTEYDG